MKSSTILRFTPVHFVVLILSASVSFAQSAVTQSYNLDGVLTDSSGNPISSPNAEFTITIYDPTQQCQLYQEQQTVSIGADGEFNLAIGSEVTHIKRISGDPGLPMEGVFSNGTAKSCGSGSGIGMYTPTSGDHRILKIAVDPDGSGGSTYAKEDFSSQIIRAVPQATVADRAESLQGLTPASLLLVNSSGGYSLTQNNLQNIFSAVNYAKLQSLLTYNPTDYVRTDTNGSISVPAMATDPGTLAAGQIWYDSTGNSLKYFDGTTAKTVSSSSSSGTVTTVTAGTGLNVGAGPGGSITTTGTLNIDVGTTAGKIVQLNGSAQLPNVDGSLLTNVNAASVSGVVHTQDLKVYDSDSTNYVQFVSPATSSLTTNYTLTLPSGAPASNGSVIKSDTSGNLSFSLLGISDIKSTVGPTYNPVFPTTCTSSETLVWNAGTGVYDCASIPVGSGDITDVIAGAGLTGGATTGSATLDIGAGTGIVVNANGISIDVGTADGKIVQVQMGGKLPALDASNLTGLAAAQIPNLDANKIATGTIVPAVGGTGQSSYTDGQLLIGNSSGNTLTKSTLTAGAGVNITNGNGSITIASDLGSSVDLTSEVTGTLSLANGGTGAATATGAFNALSPATTKGDLVTRDGTNNIRLPVGSDGKILRADSAQASGLSWGALNSGDITTALTYTPVNKAGDAMTGGLTVGGNLIVGGNLGLNQVASDPTTAGWDNTQKGYAWFNTSSNEVKYWDGSAIKALGVSGSGLSSLGGQTGSSQTFAVDAAGTTPAISSSLNTHTLSIPLASGAGVTSGTISKTDYDAFSAKLDSSTGFGGDVSGTYNSLSVNRIKGKDIVPDTYGSGQFLRFDGTNWVNAALAAGDIPALSATQITSGTLAVDRGGTGAATLGSGNLLVGNGTGAVNSLAASAMGNVIYGSGAATWSSGSPDTAGLVDKNSAQTITGAKYFQNSTAIGNYLEIRNQNELRLKDSDSSNHVGFRSPASVTGDQIWTLPAADGSTNQVLKTDGSGNLSWTTALTAATAFEQNGSSFGGDATLGTNDPYALKFETSGSPRVTVLPSGNVGIGITAPGTILDISGAQTFREMPAPALSPADQGRIYFDDTANKFKVSENGGAYVDLVYGYTPVNNAGGTMTGALILSTDPSVNLGAATKQYVDAAHTSAQTYTDTTFITKSLPTPPSVGNNGQSIRWNNGTNVWEYYTPTFGVGDFLSDGSISMSGQLKGTPSGTGSAVAPSFTFSADQNTGMYSPVADSLAFSTGGTTRMSIDASGNVGIGQTGPAHLLTVFDSNSSPSASKTAQGTYMTISPSGNQSGVQNVALAASVTKNSNFTVNDLIGIQSFASASSGTGSVTNIVGAEINTSAYSTFPVGNVFGIKISDPGTSTNVSNRYSLYIGAPSTSAGQDFGIYQAGSSQKNYFAGNVGIGTSTNPTVKLQITGSDVNIYSPNNGASSSPAGTVASELSNMSPTDNSGVFQRFRVTSNSGAQPQRGYIGATSNNTGYSPSLVMGLQTNANAYDEKLRVEEKVITAKTQLVSEPASALASSSTVDFAKSNTITLDSPLGPDLFLNNLVPGGSYTIIIRDPTVRMYTFNNGGGGGGCTTSRFKPANANTAGGHSIYSIFFVNNVCYISWSTGWF